MAETSAIDIDEPKSKASPVLALAEQLRDGPLQDLVDLQLRAHDLAVRMETHPGDDLRDLAELVRLSLTAMERFHGFTRDFQALLRDLGDASDSSH